MREKETRERPKERARDRRRERLRDINGASGIEREEVTNGN
jgi:hypothetical protein